MTDRPEPVRIVIDTDRCQANALCFQMADDLFQIGDDEIAYVTRDLVRSPRDLDVARAAAKACPVGAISLEPASQAGRRAAVSRDQGAGRAR